MYRLLYGGLVYKYETLDQALEASKLLQVEWTILDPNGDVAFDWMDRVGP
jgi:hypothetical protein